MTVNSLLLYDSLGFASNVLSLINGFKVAKYLTHIHGNPPKIEWFLDNVSKLNSISDFIGVVASIIDGYGVYQQTGSSSKGVFTIAYDIGAMALSSYLGCLIGGLVLGPAGAIVVTLAIMSIESLFQIFKEDVVDVVDNAWNIFCDWIAGVWR